MPQEVCGNACGGQRNLLATGPARHPTPVQYLTEKKNAATALARLVRGNTKRTVANIVSNSMPEWLDLKALTKYACVSERTLREWIHRSDQPLPASQVGAKLLIKRSDFDRWMTSHRVTQIKSVDVDAVVSEVLAGLESRV
jgi:excisionase family DNA binding protein